jgi:hypothetical protein
MITSVCAQCAHLESGDELVTETQTRRRLSCTRTVSILKWLYPTWVGVEIDEYDSSGSRITSRIFVHQQCPLGLHSNRAAHSFTRLLNKGA